MCIWCPNLPTALSGDPHRGQQPRHFRKCRSARVSDIRCGAARHAFRAGLEYQGISRSLPRRRSPQGGEGVFAGARLYRETDRQARDEPEESFYRWLGDQLEASASRPGARAIEQRAERGQRLQTITYGEALRDKVVVGTPERVTDHLHALREELDLDGILAEMNCGSLIPHQRVMRSLQLLCEKVMPSFH